MRFLRSTVLTNMKGKALAVAIAASLAATMACGDDDPVEVIPPDSEFQSLTTRSAVLNNIEAAYEKRRLDKYDELLDANFTFFLSNGDVGGGLPPSWGRADEITSHTNMFSPNPPVPKPRVEQIQMDIRLEDGLVWEVSNPPAAPDEDWYTTTLNYQFKFEVEPDTNYLNVPTAKATFTLRNAGTDDAPHWLLVEMHDLSDESAAPSFTASTEQSSWGQVKALYR